MLRTACNTARAVASVAGSNTIPAGVHPSQLASLTDSLIQVDELDNVLGPVGKLESHLAAGINSGILHRAFSVFLFSTSSNSLLIQKRADTKIAFPQQWANACCSHPLFVESEMEDVGCNKIGIKRAAVKRLREELGIENYPLSGLTFTEKILYRQLSPNGVFGEAECDYILLGRLDDLAVPVKPHPDEVAQFEWIRPGAAGDRTSVLRDFVHSEKQKGFTPTPWFELMMKQEECLERWWSGMISNEVEFKTDSVSGSIRNFLHKY